MADFESKVISSRAVLPIQGTVAGDFGLGTQYRSAGFDAAAVRWDGLAEPRSRATQLPDPARIFAVDGPSGAGYVDLDGRLALLAAGQDANGGRPWRTEGVFGSDALATLPNARVLRTSVGAASRGLNSSTEDLGGGSLDLSVTLADSEARRVAIGKQVREQLDHALSKVSGAARYEFARAIVSGN